MIWTKKWDFFIHIGHTYVYIKIGSDINKYMESFGLSTMCGFHEAMYIVKYL